jgi:DnaK suppressor protein
MAKMQTRNLPEGYEPKESEEYMSEEHLIYFEQKLLDWKSELLSESRETLEHLQHDRLNQPDISDQAAMEAEAAVELRNGDRKRKLISKIDEAFQRIVDGEYGYCGETGEPIGIERLKARPIATLCIEAQERHEKYEKQFVDEQSDEEEYAD